VLEHVAAEDAVEALTVELVKHRPGVADEDAVELSAASAAIARSSSIPTTRAPAASA
jgi:hypothetical protein